MNIKLIKLNKYHYLIMGDNGSAVVAVDNLAQLAKELNTVAKEIGFYQDLYRVAIDRDMDSLTYGKQVLLMLVPGSQYTRVPVS